MKNSPLMDKSKSFALEVIKVCNHIKKTKKESVLTNQLIRSGTSIGANIREAQYAHGRADFTAKLQIALKEANETGYWLELLFKTGYITEEKFRLLDSHCTSIRAMLISSINTAKTNSN